MISISLRKSSLPHKKWSVTISGPADSRTRPRTRTVHFGAAGYEDFTTHKDETRKQRYITRHRKREDWTAKGIYSPGFWSRWILWNKPTLRGSIADANSRFNLRIRLRRE
jgi:hypothetical protein